MVHWRVRRRASLRSCSPSELSPGARKCCTSHKPLCPIRSSGDERPNPAKILSEDASVLQEWFLKTGRFLTAQRIMISDPTSEVAFTVGANPDDARGVSAVSPDFVALVKEVDSVGRQLVQLRLCGRPDHYCCDALSLLKAEPVEGVRAEAQEVGVFGDAGEGSFAEEFYWDVAVEAAQV